MKKLAMGIALVSLTLVSACGEDEPVETPSVGTDATAEPEESSDDPDDDSSDEPTADESDDGDDDGDDDSDDDAMSLTAVVGTDDDPDAFVIMLMDDAGEMVTDLPAGDYTIEVDDPSAIHNFHLTGGDVDESTTVDEVTQTTWDVTLEAGDYEYVCDPHPNMSGAFTVT